MRANLLGAVSVFLSLAFWAYADSGIGPNAFTQSPYVIFVLLPGTLAIAALIAVVAALLGSKWWFLALIGPVSGALLLYSARV